MGDDRSAQAHAVLVCFLTAVIVSIAVLVAQDFLLRAYFPHLERFTTDFSPTYLRRELDAISAQPPQALFLGDSVLWGYRLPASQTMVSLLASRGCRCRNLALKSGSPPNYYALVRVLAKKRVRPEVVVLEINQKAFNPADSSYRTLHPGIAGLAEPLLTPSDRALLRIPSGGQGIAATVDRDLASFWLLYALRADIGETLYGDFSPPAVARPSVEAFYGTYDLTALDERNVGVHFLQKTATELQRAHIPVLAFMTPTNHALLHEYLDDPAYGANSGYLRRLLHQRGVRVLDLDRSFAASEFFDNAHLTAAGQRHLASVLTSALAPMISVAADGRRT